MMRADADAGAEMAAIEEAAAAWLVERDRGFTRARADEFARWRAADARHAAAFAALAETWTLLGESAACGAGDQEAERESGRGRTWRWATASWAAGLAAAAVFAVAFFGVAEWRTKEGGPESAHEFVLTAATEVGALRTVALPDGSTIQLNTDSAVEVRFDAGARRVRLARGEAHFAVAKNAARPFVVSAAGVDVRVLGTIFNVRLRAESVDVLVTEGKVRVGAAADRVMAPGETVTGVTESELTAGQKVSLGRANGAEKPAKVAEAPVVVSPVEMRQALAWQTRRLDFDAAPLSEIVGEINRYNRHQLVIADEELKERKFGGSFPANDYATLVRMLEADFGVVAERRGGETRLRVKR